MIDFSHPEILDAVKRALDEDIGPGDVTSEACVPTQLMAHGRFIARQQQIVAGPSCLPEIYQLRGGVEQLHVEKPSRRLRGGGRGHRYRARSWLVRCRVQRVALNFPQRLGGIATPRQALRGHSRGTDAAFWIRARPPQVCGVLKDGGRGGRRDQPPHGSSADAIHQESHLGGCRRRGQAIGGSPPRPNCSIEIEGAHLSRNGEASSRGAAAMRRKAGYSPRQRSKPPGKSPPKNGGRAPPVASRWKTSGRMRRRAPILSPQAPSRIPRRRSTSAFVWTWCNGSGLMPFDLEFVRQNWPQPVFILRPLFHHARSRASAEAGGAHGAVVVADEQTAGQGRHRHIFGTKLRTIHFDCAAPMVRRIAARADAGAGTGGGGRDLPKRRASRAIFKAQRRHAGRAHGGRDPRATSRFRAIASIGVNLNRGVPAEIAADALLRCFRTDVRASNCSCRCRGGPLLWLPAPRLSRDCNTFSRRSSYARNMRVKVDQGVSILEGTTAGLDSSGFLIVRKDDGTQQLVLAGGVRPG